MLLPPEFGLPLHSPIQARALPGKTQSHAQDDGVRPHSQPEPHRIPAPLLSKLPTPGSLLPPGSAHGRRPSRIPRNPGSGRASRPRQCDSGRSQAGGIFPRSTDPRLGVRLQCKAGRPAHGLPQILSGDFHPSPSAAAAELRPPPPCAQVHGHLILAIDVFRQERPPSDAHPHDRSQRDPRPQASRVQSIQPQRSRPVHPDVHAGESSRQRGVRASRIPRRQPAGVGATAPCVQRRREIAFEGAPNPSQEKHP